MSFKARIHSASVFEQAVIQFLQDGGFTVARLGTEHTLSTFMDSLRARCDPVSIYLRCAPDFAVYDSTRTFLMDAKAGHLHIERLPYEHYMRLQREGIHVVLIFENDGAWQWNFVDRVRLIHGAQTIARFPPEKRFPVDDDGWICPRQSAVWSHDSGRFSGTPYREVALSSLKPIATLINVQR